MFRTTNTSNIFDSAIAFKRIAILKVTLTASATHHVLARLLLGHVRAGQGAFLRRGRRLVGGRAGVEVAVGRLWGSVVFVSYSMSFPSVLESSSEVAGCLLYTSDAADD